MQNAQEPYTLALMNEPFFMYLIQHFQVYCLERMLIPNIPNLLSFLLASSFFSGDIMSQYVIVNDYRSWARMDHYPNKTQTIKAIAARYKMEEERVWKVLQEPRYPFE